MNRRPHRAWILVAVAASWPLATLGVGADDACHTPGPVASSDVLDGCVVDVDGDLVVPDGVTLTLTGGTVLRLTNTSQPVSLTVASGGALILDASRVEAADGVDLEIRLEAGSVGDLRDATLDGYETLLLRTDSVAVENVTFVNATTALDVEEALVVVRNSTVAASVAAAVGENATLRFEETTWVGAVGVASTGHFEAAWFVHVTVDLSQLDGVASAALEARDATDAVRAEKAMNHDEVAMLRLPAEFREGSDRVVLDPYRFVVTAGTRATFLDIDLAPELALELQVPDDPDTDPPVWPADALRQVGGSPGYSTDGSVHLAWDAADDTVAQAHANRAVSHYRVLEGDDVLVERTRATQAVVENLTEGPHALRVEAVDLVGNAAATPPLFVDVDTTPPNVSFEADTDASAAGAYGGPVNVTIAVEEAGDAPTGLVFLRWRIGDGATTHVEASGSTMTLELSDEVPLDSTGNHTLTVTTEDVAGNRVVVAHNVVLDMAPPTFLASLAPGLPAGAWHHEAPTLRVTVLDAGPSGTDSVRYRVDGGAWRDVDNGSATVDDTGERLLEVEVADGAGNRALTQMRLAYDPEAPVLSTQTVGTEGEAGWFVTPVRLEANASDDASGVDRIEHRIAQGAWRPLDGHLNLTESGTHEVSVRAVDAAGNQALKALTVPVDRDAPTAPNVSWAALPDGRLRGDWSADPPRDLVSGVAAVRVERAAADGASVASHLVDSDASGHVLVGLAAGEHRLRVAVVDAAGHESVTPWSTVRTIGSAAAQASAQADRVRGVVLLTPDAAVAAEDLVEVRYFVDGLLRHATAEAPYEYAWSTESVENGAHEVRIVAVDSAGLHHEQVLAFNVRNGYAAAWLDDAPAGVLAVTLSTLGLGLSIVGYVRWRRWAFT